MDINYDHMDLVDSRSLDGVSLLVPTLPYCEKLQFSLHEQRSLRNLK
jgi:hypothetical protein